MDWNTLVIISGSKDAELINDYIKLLLKKIRFYEAQGQKKIIIDGFPRSMENLEGWNKLVGDKVHVSTFSVVYR